MLLVAPRREQRLAGLVAWLAGAAGLALYLAPDGRAAELAVAAVLGAALALAGAAVLLRRPWALAFATVACIPVRIPIDVGREDANLLLPLYLVVGSLALALGKQLLSGDERSRELGPVAAPLAALVAWTGLALVWSEDLRQGAIFLAAFVLPFGLLAVGFARLPWSRRALLGVYGTLLATALAYAGIGLYQWATRDVFWNPKLKVDNAYAPFFRVNSVFWDPSIYGRYLVVAILATLGLVLLGERRQLLIGGIAAIAALWTGLLFSFSQSSFAALIAGTLAVATVVWRLRAAAALAFVAVVLVSVGFATPQVRNTLLDESRAGWNAATSGRAGLISNGLRIARDNPVLGVGAGQQSRIDCTRLAGAKVDAWWLRRHGSVRSLVFKPNVRRQDRVNWQLRYIEGDMTGAERERFRDAVQGDPRPLTASARASWLAGLGAVALASDGYVPFRDNIDEAARHGVRYLAHPGGSTRNREVEAAAVEHGITIVDTGIRLFHH